MNPRLPVLKTYKLCIGGQFPRSESGRTLPLRHGDSLIANICQGSRKDARDAVVAARKAQGGWAAKTSYNRGQILYRMAEVLEQRRAELLDELAKTGKSVKLCAKELDSSVDRLVWYAGWADKYAQLLGTVNPVAAPYFNFTLPEPTGVVVLVPPDYPALLGLISLLAPVIVAGNSTVVMASETNPLPAVTLGEILATSDLPGGVVNILTGHRHELLPPLASHMDVNAVVYAAGDPKEAALIQREGVANVKRVVVREGLSETDWTTDRTASPWWIADTVELKTVWHPIGV